MNRNITGGLLICLAPIALPRAATSLARGGEVEVTAVQAEHRHGQTFVTWKDVAEGEADAKYRYSATASTVLTIEAKR